MNVLLGEFIGLIIEGQINTWKEEKRKKTRKRIERGKKRKIRKMRKDDKKNKKEKIITRRMWKRK